MWKCSVYLKLFNIAFCGNSASNLSYLCLSEDKFKMKKLTFSVYSQWKVRSVGENRNGGEDCMKNK